MAKKSEAASTHQLVGCEDALEAFQQFYESNEAVDILKSFDNICESLDIHPGRFVLTPGGVSLTEVASRKVTRTFCLLMIYCYVSKPGIQN